METFSSTLPNGDSIPGITYGGAHDEYGSGQGDISGISNSGAIVATSNVNSVSREWKFPADVVVDEQLIEAAGGSDILAKLLVRRGIKTAAEARIFLDPDQYTPTSPMELTDMPRAIVRISQAIAQGEHITVFGDYDVDGVTATGLMLTTLRFLGAKADYYVPTRAEGYGLNLKAVSVLASKHRTKLIISCDCGISNFSEINFAKSLGVDTIVCDHHSMPDMLPPAVAILHPKQLAEDHPLFHLPGVGVAYKLAEALLLDKGAEEEIPKLLDFVTLGMIADMVPLIKENRYLVQVGMPKLLGSQRAGIRALLAQCGAREGTDLVGFGLAPRINAVGRLSDATFAVKLMTTEDDEEASQLAHKLELENARRQELCEQIFKEAEHRAAARLAAKNDRAIAMYDKSWHHGVVGIVASRLVEKFNCPVFIGELDEAEGIVKGSARGISGIDLYEVLKANEHLALKWGGHKMAAGFSVEQAKADLFCDSIVETCNKILAEQPRNSTLDVDLEIDPDSVNLGLARLITKLAPFGMNNKKPVLAMRKMSCMNTRVLGKEGKHHRVVVGHTDERHFECVLWNSKGRVPLERQKLDVAFTPEVNSYNGTERLQLIMADWRGIGEPAAQPTARPATTLPGQPAGRPAAQPAATAPGQLGRGGLTPVPNPANSFAGNSNSANATQNFAPPGNAGTSANDTARPTGAPTVPAAKDKVVPFRGAAPRVVSSQSDEQPAIGVPGGSEGRTGSRAITWKDLRDHSDPERLLDGAVRKLGDAVAVFAEASPKVGGMMFADRTMLAHKPHLVLWQFPPSMQILKAMLGHAHTIYLVGGAPNDLEDAGAFLKKLLGVVRYAVNQKEGQADPEKVTAALGTTKMALALGLTILKKIHLIDWFAEDGCIHMDLLGQTPAAKAEELSEYRQLANCLREIREFRRWCCEAPFKELQLALVPNAVQVATMRQGLPESGDATSSGREPYDQPSNVPSSQPGKVGMD